MNSNFEIYVFVFLMYMFLQNSSLLCYRKTDRRSQRHTSTTSGKKVNWILYSSQSTVPTNQEREIYALLSSFIVLFSVLWNQSCTIWIHNWIGYPICCWSFIHPCVVLTPPYASFWFIDVDSELKLHIIYIFIFHGMIWNLYCDANYKYCTKYFCVPTDKYFGTSSACIVIYVFTSFTNSITINYILKISSLSAAVG